MTQPCLAAGALATAAAVFVLGIGVASQTPVAPPRDAPTPQSARSGTTVRGRVVRADDGQPLRRAQVDATPAVAVADGFLPRSAITDGAGQYELRDLPPGTYSLKASRTGFLTLAYGQRRAFEPGRATVLVAGATVDNLDFALPRAGVVSGRVFDEVGDPITGASVALLRYQFKNGARTLTAAGRAANSTDDLGQFRIADVPPGEYYLSAAANILGIARPEFEAGFLRTYYPGTASIGSAQKVAVRIGDELSGLTFSVVRARMASVSGVVISADGTPVDGATVSLRISSFGAFVGSNRKLTNGRFEFTELPPGDYTLEASLTAPTGREQAPAEVTLSGSDARVTMTLHKAVRIRGRIALDPPGASLRTSSVSVTAESPDGAENLSKPYMPVRDDWTFEGTVFPGWRSLLRVTAPEGWTTSRITAGGRDVTDTPVEIVTDPTDIEVVLTNTVTTVSGRVRDARGNAASDAAIVVFADDPQKWGPFTRYVRAGRLDQAGRFTIRGLPAGRYVAVAIDHLDEGEEGNPDLLARMRERGTQIILGDGESRTVDLVMAEVR